MELYKNIESYIQCQYQHTMDFEIDDGLKKLAEYKLTAKNFEGLLTVLSLDKAIPKLKEHLREALQL